MNKALLITITVILSTISILLAIGATFNALDLTQNISDLSDYELNYKLGIIAIGCLIFLPCSLGATIGLTTLMGEGKAQEEKTLEERISCAKHGYSFKQDINGGMYCAKCSPEHEKEYGIK